MRPVNVIGEHTWVDWLEDFVIVSEDVSAVKPHEDSLCMLVDLSRLPHLRSLLENIFLIEKISNNP